MYRARMAIWAVLLSITLVFFGGYKLFSIIFEEKPLYTVYCNTDDNTLKTNISNMESCNMELKDEKTNCDFIILKHSDETIQGYKKYSNYIYTPIVMWARGDCLDSEYGFTVLNSGSYSATVYKDLKIILNAMLNDKTFEDIGINKKVAEGKVTLAIPSKTSVYYDYIKELLYSTLNNGKIEESQKSAFKSDVNNILDKCQKVEDVGQKIIALDDKENKDYKLFLGPESVCARDCYSFCSRESWVPVYLNATYNIGYDLYVKAEKSDELIKALKDSDFSEETGYRIFNDNKLSKKYNYIIDNITIFQ